MDKQVNKLPSKPDATLALFTGRRYSTTLAIPAGIQDLLEQRGQRRGWSASAELRRLVAIALRTPEGLREATDQEIQDART